MIAKIGAGGSATVYKVRHRARVKSPWLKVSPRFVKLTSDVVKRFRQEFTVIRPLRHPNIVRAVGWGEHDGFTYLAMEIRPGPQSRKSYQSKGPLSLKEAAPIFLQFCRRRVLFARSADSSSRHQAEQHLSDTEQSSETGRFRATQNLNDDGNLTHVLGKAWAPLNMAPRNNSKTLSVDQRCDLCSLAAAAIYCAHGRIPFGNGGPMQILQRKFLNQFVPLRVLLPTLDPVVDNFVTGACVPIR